MARTLEVFTRLKESSAMHGISLRYYKGSHTTEEGMQLNVASVSSEILIVTKYRTHAKAFANNSAMATAIFALAVGSISLYFAVCISCMP